MRSLCRLVVATLLWTTTSGVAVAVDPLFQQSVLFSSGDGYTAYRVPGMVTSHYGTLLAFAEGRPTSADLGENDIVLKRSLDNGQTWQTMQVPLPHALAGVPTRGFNGPTPVVDRSTGDIFLFATRPALAGSNNYAEMFVSKSSDDGVTWSTPTNISAAIRPYDDKYISTAPGHGVQLDGGRLVIPIYSRPFNDNSQSAVPHIIYSDDDGTSWQLGGEVPKPTYSGQSLPVSLVEPSIVDTDNGLYMNMRTRAYAPSMNRSYSFSTDGGMTWSTSQIDPTLIDSNTEGALARWTTLADDGLNRILLSNTYSSTARENLTVQTSYDEAQSWANPRTIFFGRSAYSDMAAGSDGVMNLLYENGRNGDPRYPTVNQYQQITLARFNTEWLETPQTYALQFNFAEQAPGNVVSTNDAAIRDANPWQLHAEAVGGMVYVAGPAQTDNRAIHLDGTDYILMRNSATQHFFDLRADDSFTIEAILRTTEHGTGGLAGAGMIMGRGTQVADNSILFAPHWYLQIVDGKLDFNLRDAAGNVADLQSDVAVNDGQWHSVAAIRDAQNHGLKLIIDGRLAGYYLDPTGTFGALDDPNNAYVGLLNDGTRGLIADVDMVRFSEAALQSYELASIPEPSSLLMTAVACGGMIYKSRRSRSLTK